MRLDLPATTGLLRARTGSCRQLSTLEISVSVAFSASLTETPPMPRNPPSLEASATCWLIWRSQPLKAAASFGALASTTAPACRSVSMHLALISAGLLPVSFSFRPSRAVLRPSAVSKSATTALISASAPGSILAVISALPSAKLSFRRPHRPLGSAAETAIPATITLSRRSFHSSGVKFDLSGMGLLLCLSSWSASTAVSAASTAGTVPTVDDRGWQKSGGQHSEFCPQGVDCRLQQIGHAGDRQHLVEQLVERRHQRIHHPSEDLPLLR